MSGSSSSDDSGSRNGGGNDQPSGNGSPAAGSAEPSDAAGSADSSPSSPEDDDRAALTGADSGTSSPGTSADAEPGSSKPGSLEHDFPAIAGLPEVESILPELDGGPPDSIGFSARLSPEIETLLRESAQRVRESKPASVPQPLESNPAVLPPDMVALIDELLDQDEDLAPAPPSGTGAGTPEATGAGQAVSRVETVTHDGATTGAAAARGEPAPSNAESAAPPAAGPPFARAEPQPLTESGLTSMNTVAKAADTQPPPSIPESVPTGQSPLETLPPGTVRMDPKVFAIERPAGTEPEQAPSALFLPVEGVGANGDLAAGPLAEPGQIRPAVAAAPPASAEPATTPQGQRDPSRSEPPQQAAGRTTSMPPPHTEAQFDRAWGPGSVRYREQTDPLHVMALAITHRATGSLALKSEASAHAEDPATSAVRRILLRDGDSVTAASALPDERLIDFLVLRGDISAEVASARAAKLPRVGRHAAAALIAHGFLGQDDLWSVLRAHAEWIISRALQDTPAACELEREPPNRLRAEPNVFGGAAGVEIFVEAVRRVVAPGEALARLGGERAVLAAGQHGALLAESALNSEDQELVLGAQGSTVGRVLETAGAEFGPVLYALVLLSALSSTPQGGLAPSPAEVPFDPLDANAVRERVRARMQLVQEADYFALLGVAPHATNYEIRRAYLALRRGFEPSRLLTAATADLADDVVLIVEVIEEAYQILRDQHRRERYRRALVETS